MKVIKLGNRTWKVIKEKEVDGKDSTQIVWIDFNGFHCSCIFSNIGDEIRECSHILGTKKTIGREEEKEIHSTFQDALSSYEEIQNEKNK